MSHDVIYIVPCPHYTSYYVIQISHLFPIEVGVFQCLLQVYITNIVVAIVFMMPTACIMLYYIADVQIFP